VDLKDKIRSVLKGVYGGFETYLEMEYENCMAETLSSGTIEDKKEWITYNQVILELKHNIKDMIRVKELQYRILDELEPRRVFMDVIQKIDCKSDELDRLYNKIKNF
jgi:hypothetical protein